MLAKVRNLQIACYAIPYLLFVYALSFPLNLYENFFREHQYGLATQSFAPWFREQLLGLALTLVGGTLLVVVLYAVFRRAPRAWWIWGTIVMIIFSGTLVLIAPVYIEPLFNTYKPITDPKIRDPILAMARANEIPVKQVFEVDASRQTTRVSANVSGLLGTTRVALNDNLLKQCTLPEIRAVMAHEMGHYVLNHGAKLLTYLGILILVGFALTRILFDAAVKRWGEKWGVRGISDPAGLPLLALIFSTLVFIATPFLNTVVRITEREADAFGINTSREPDGMAKSALKLGDLSQTRSDAAWKNSSFSIIPAVAHASAWLWIGKGRICRLGNRCIWQATCHSLTSHPASKPADRRPYPVSRGCCEGAAAVKANLRFRISIKLRM